MSSFGAQAQERQAHSPDYRQRARCRVAVDMVFDLVKRYDPSLDDEQIWWRMMRTGFLMQIEEFAAAVAHEGPVFWAARVLFPTPPTRDQVAALQLYWARHQSGREAPRVSA